jgi:predicted SAM-dependent methyltransferase
MKVDKSSWLYSSLKWAYQPIKAVKSLSQDLSYIPRRDKLIKHFAEAEFAGLHIGCGPFHLDNWINTDLPPNPCMDFPLDISRPLPFRDRYFHVIYGQEVIEHIPLNEGRNFLREAWRVLRPGGVIRLTTPDLKNICRIYLRQNPKVSPDKFGTVWLEGEFSEEIWINALFRAWGHQFLYSFDSLEKEMKAAGFCSITEVQPQVTQSRFSELNNLETRYGDRPPEWVFESSFIVEASKPDC